MEYVVSILILFVVLSTLLKISFWRWWQQLLLAAFSAAFVLLSYPYATEQSQTVIATWLRTHTIMQNLAVLITLEVSIIFWFTFRYMKKALGIPSNGKRGVPLRWYPGLLLFPTLFFILSNTFFVLPGVSFAAISYTFAGCTFAMVGAGAMLLKKLIPEDELRLEMLFVVNLFVCIVGLITTVNGETAYAPVKQEYDFVKLALALTLFLLLFFAGFLIRRIRRNKIEL